MSLTLLKKRNKIIFSLMLLVTVALPLNEAWSQSRDAESCLIGGQEFKKVMSTKNAAIIDVRSSGDFATFHVPSSLNIKAHEIKTKVFLKGKQVVLIGYGYDSAALIETCKALKSGGFKSVYILENGIAGWVYENQLGLLSPLINQSVYYLQPADIANITDINHVLVINLASKDTELLEKYFANVHTISASSNKKLLQHLKHTSIAKKTQFHYMIVIDANGQSYPALHELNQAKTGMPVMFLFGGLEELHQYAKKQSAISNKTEFTLQNLKGCGNL